MPENPEVEAWLSTFGNPMMFSGHRGVQAATNETRAVVDAWCSDSEGHTP